MNSGSVRDSSQRRLPTQSAAEALATQLGQSHGGFTTGSEALDRSWGGVGLEKGKLLEICGPPGSGKTAIAFQLVLDAVSKGEQVCWIDTLTQCSTARLGILLSKREMASKAASILRYQALSLAHLFALIAHLTQMPMEISLLVIDSISLLFTKEFPPDPDTQYAQSLLKKNLMGREKHEKQLDKRGRLMADFAKRLQRLSASRITSVVVMNQLTTRAVLGGPLELAPSISSANQVWSYVFHHRILLLRKHVPKSDPLTKRHLRFVFVLKSLGVDIQNTNLSRPDQFFVVTVTENGVEDEKQQVFDTAGAIPIAESFALSGDNSDHQYYDGFSDSDEEPDFNPSHGRLKRKRSNETSSDSELNGGKGLSTGNTDTGYSSDGVDLVPVPASDLAGPGPILDSGQSDNPVESQDKTNPGIPQNSGRMFVPDSDGESDDDVF